MTGGLRWWHYVRAAFGFRWPTRWFGALPLNHLALAAGVIFMALFLLAGKLSAVLGVLMLTAAYELLYLYLVCSLPRFRAMVDADVASRKRSDELHTQQDLARGLDKRSRERYEAMLATCAEIEELVQQREVGGPTFGEVLKTGGLVELQNLFVRLLHHRDSLRSYWSTTTARMLPDQVDTIKQELRSKTLADAVRRSKEQTLAILEQRTANLNAMKQSFELADAELQRIEQQLVLIKEQAVVSSDVAALASQVDSVVEGITETTDWLMASERMLASPDQELEQLTTDAS